MKKQRICKSKRAGCLNSHLADSSMAHRDQVVGKNNGIAGYLDRNPMSSIHSQLGANSGQYSSSCLRANHPFQSTIKAGDA